MASVQALLKSDKAPRLLQRQCFWHGLAFTLIMPHGQKEIAMASGNLQFVMKHYREMLSSRT